MTKEERQNKFLLENPNFFENKKQKYVYKYKPYVKRPIHDKICLKCNKIFKYSLQNQKYCSEKCQKSNRYDKNKEKQLIRWKVWHAVKIGKIIKPLSCEHCKQTKKLQGHHTDYKKPLIVIWLCSTCHRLADNLLKH